MSAVSLSKRLRTAADMVREGAVVADVGCDHGKMSAFLLLSGKKTPFVYATDIRPMPLEKARKLFDRLGLSSQSCCLLTDGLVGVPGERVDDVVIAGLGADVTASVIKRAEWLYDPGKRLILVPASKKERLREFLADEGFETIEEKAVLDHGHFYAVIHARYNGEKRKISLREKWLGSIDTGTEEGKGYLNVIKKQMERIVDAVEDPANENRIEAVRFLEEIR